MEINEFLVKAKINTYAGSGEGGEIGLPDGGKELVFKEDGWKYRDRYFGFEPFIGEEIVSKDGLVVWGMNYYGGIVSDKAGANHIYHFLKKAMKLVKIERPFRGPSVFQEGEWGYSDKSVGTVDKFDGIETIYFQKEKVHEVKYHGGVISK